MELKSWIFGLLFSVVAGGAVTAAFLYALRGVLGLGDKPNPKNRDIKRVPPWITGTVERLVFTVFIGSGIEAAPAMIGWLALKLATNWNRDDWNNNPKTRPFAFTALLAGLISMLFAALGGLICKGELWAKLITGI